MENIVALKKYSTTELKQINQVRMFYQSYSYADIFNGQGNHLRKGVLAPTQPAETSTMKWPATRPYTTDFAIWNEAMKILLTF